MTSIVDVASHWPRQVALADRTQALGLSAVDLRRYTRGFGLDLICWDPEESESDALHAAADKLTGLKGREHLVRYVVRARTVRFSAPYPMNPLRDVVTRLGLDHAHAFTVTDQACAAGLGAVDLAGTLLAADGDPDALALVLCGEKAITRASQIVPGVSITGEATAAVLVGADSRSDAGGGRVRGFAVETLPIPGSALVMTASAHERFGAAYPRVLGEVVRGALDAAGWQAGDIDLVLPHNVNALVWRKLAGGLGLRVDDVFLDNIARTGHCFAADPFVNYVSARELGRIDAGTRVLMTSVGLGATFAAMVLER